MFWLNILDDSRLHGHNTRSKWLNNAEQNEWNRQLRWLNESTQSGTTLDFYKEVDESKQASIEQRNETLDESDNNYNILGINYLFKIKIIKLLTNCFYYWITFPKVAGKWKF